jgi:hypothetical protein
VKRLGEFWRKNFLGAELFLALVVTALFVVWAEWIGGSAELQGLLDGRRSTVYGAFAAIAGSLLGFVIATISIVLGLSSSPRLKRVRDSAAYGTLWSVFTASIKSMGFATVALLAALLFDREGAPKLWLLYVATGSVLLAFLRLWRCIWALEHVIKIVSSDKRDSR